jgi:hypothetical protein
VQAAERYPLQLTPERRATMTREREDVGRVSKRQNALPHPPAGDLLRDDDIPVAAGVGDIQVAAFLAVGAVTMTTTLTAPAIEASSALRVYDGVGTSCEVGTRRDWR